VGVSVLPPFLINAEVVGSQIVGNYVQNMWLVGYTVWVSMHTAINSGIIRFRHVAI
jgi:hypothetical protein